MLPDFPDLKAELAEKLTEFLQSRIDFHMGALSSIRRVRLFEGDARKKNTPQGDRSWSFKHVSSELIIEAKDLPGMRLGEVLGKLDGLARDMARQMADHTYRTISEAAAGVGNIVDGKSQKLNAELMLDAYASLHIDFDASGHPRMPEMHIHPRMKEAAELASNELDSNPQLRQRLRKLIEEKREEWRAREAARSLAG